MKVSIMGFNQEYAVSLRKEVDARGKMVERKIDCTDLLILRWFVDFYPKMRKIEHEGKQYAWLTRKKLAEDLPIVDISAKAFSERLQKLVDFKILTYVLIKEGGTFAAYGFGENYDKLINATVSVQTDTGGGLDGQGVSVQTDNKDKPIIYRPIKDKPKENINKEIYVSVIDYLNAKAGTAYRATSRATQQQINARLAEGFTVEDFQRVIDNKCADWLGSDWEQYLRPSTLFGSKFEQYLNSKPKQAKGANGIAVSSSPSDLDGVF